MFNFLKKIIILLHYYLINKILDIVHFLFFKKIKFADNIKKILILRTGSIGDNICALPAIHQIKMNFEHAAIDILTNLGANSKLSIHHLLSKEYYNELINYQSGEKIKLFHTLKNNKYDLFIELTQVDSYPSRLLRNMFIVYLLRIKHAFKWTYHVSYLFPRFQEKNFTFPNETDRLLNNFEKTKLKTYEKSYPFAFSKTITEKIHHVLKTENLENQKIIGIAIGSKLSRNKWPLAYFKEVIDFLVNRNYKIILFGGKEDFEPAEQIKTNEHSFNFCGKFSPLESIELMKHCQLVISNDTGPLHMAYSVKTPVIGIFSSREYPGKWFPPAGQKNRVFRTENMPCSICWARGKNKACSSNICMQKIKPSQVIESANNILESIAK